MRRELQIRRFAEPAALAYDFFPAMGRWAGYTFSRPSGGTLLDLDADGLPDPVGVDVPRLFTGGLLAGVLAIEGARTEHVTNNEWAGAIVGTPGTHAGAHGVPSTVGGLTRSVVGFGTYPDGTPFIDIRYAGTMAGFSAAAAIVDERAAGTIGEAWTTSIDVELVGGAMPIEGVTLDLRMTERTGSSQTGYATSFFVPDGIRRTVQATRQNVGPTTDTVRALVAINCASTVPGLQVDVTLRFSAFSMRRGEFIWSPIRTSGAAVTTAKEVVSRPCSPAEVRQGAVVAEFLAPEIGSIADYGSVQLWHFNIANDRLGLRYALDGEFRAAFLYSNTLGNRASISTPPLAAGGVHRVAASWGPQGWAFAHNGILLDSSSLPIKPPAASAVEIIGNEARSGPPCLVRRVMRYHAPLPVADLLALTSNQEEAAPEGFGFLGLNGRALSVGGVPLVLES